MNPVLLQRETKVRFLALWTPSFIEIGITIQPGVISLSLFWLTINLYIGDTDGDFAGGEVHWSFGYSPSYELWYVVLGGDNQWYNIKNWRLEYQED